MYAFGASVIPTLALKSVPPPFFSSLRRQRSVPRSRERAGREQQPQERATGDRERGGVAGRDAEMGMHVDLDDVEEEEVVINLLRRFGGDAGIAVPLLLLLRHTQGERGAQVEAPGAAAASFAVSLAVSEVHPTRPDATRPTVGRKPRPSKLRRARTM